MRPPRRPTGSLRQRSPPTTCANRIAHAFDLAKASRRGGDQPARRLVSQRDAAWADALFVAIDDRQQTRSRP
ncbi:hypothetical protein C3489_28350 [Streptomyces sp. Ru71]|nr:hypothetical protein C3489_28350 [Streptomyces sp. Ru71]